MHRAGEVRPQEEGELQVHRGEVEERQVHQEEVEGEEEHPLVRGEEEEEEGEEHLLPLGGEVEVDHQSLLQLPQWVAGLAE